MELVLFKRKRRLKSVDEQWSSLNLKLFVADGN